MEDQDKQIVTFCRLCEVTYQTKFPQTICPLCTGDLEEIGWVGKNG